MTDGLAIFGLMLLGPSVAGLTLTARYMGRAGLAELAARIRRWRAGPSLWAVALLANPVALLIVLVVLALVIGPEYSPGFLPLGLAIGLVAGGIEELGWTGFATPRLLARFSPLKAGLVVGLLWASWHGLADFAGNIGGMTVGEWVLRFVAYWLIPLTAYRVLMTWVYSHTGSVLVAMLMHASYTGWQASMTPVSLSDSESLTWYAVFAVAITVVVSMVVRSSATRRAPEAVRPATASGKA